MTEDKTQTPTSTDEKPDNKNSVEESPEEELWLGLFPKKYRSLCIIGVLDFLCGALLQSHHCIFLNCCFTVRIALTTAAVWGNVHENKSIITFTPFIYFLYLFCFVIYFTSSVFADDFFETSVWTTCASSYFSSVALFYCIVWLQIDFEVARADIQWKADMQAKGRLNALLKDAERKKEKATQEFWTQVGKLYAYFAKRWTYLALTGLGIGLSQIFQVWATLLNADILQSAVNRDASRVWHLMKLRVFCTIANTLAHSVQAYYQRMVREYVAYDMRKISVKMALEQEIGYYDEVGSSSEVFSTAWHRVGRLTGHLGWHLRCMFEFSVRSIMILVCMLQTDVRFTILLTTMSPILMTTHQYFNEHCKRLSRLLRDNWEELDRRVSESIHNIRTVTAFGGEESELKYINSLLTETYNELWYEIAYCETRWSFGNFLRNTANFFLYYYSVTMLIRGEIDLATVVKFCAFEGHMSWMMNSLSDFQSQMQRLLISAYKVFKLIEREPEHKFATPGKKPDCNGKLEFKNVSMAYPTALDKVTIENLSLTINPGEMVAFVGESGCGKSTVLSLMNFMYGYQKGQVLLDGVPLNEWNKEHFYKNVVTVPQESILFARTIEENIKFGLDASREDVIVAAKKANCHDFIEEMERGYMSIVGERGTNLSGGQKQRISIARALLRDPKILLLDEATSALDTKSERCVQSALHDVMENNKNSMSIVVIAHRLSTIRKANRIVVFDKKAQIIEIGDHDYLMKLNGHYAELVNQQKLTDLDEKETKPVSRLCMEPQVTG